MKMKIEIQITKEDAKRQFGSIQDRNVRLSLLASTAWMKDRFDLVIWMPNSPGDELNGYWAQGKIQSAENTDNSGNSGNSGNAGSGQ